MNTGTGVVADNLYDNRTRTWTNVNTLLATDPAPLSSRDENGLACALAIRLADAFSQQPSQDMVLTATRFEEALCNNWSVAAELVINPDYF